MYYVPYTALTMHLSHHPADVQSGTMYRVYGNFDIIFGRFVARFSALSHPHTRRVLCSSWYPCWVGAEWCLQSDGVANLGAH